MAPAWSNCREERGHEVVRGIYKPVSDMILV